MRELLLFLSDTTAKDFIRGKWNRKPTKQWGRERGGGSGRHVTMCQAPRLSQGINELRGRFVWEAGEGKPSLLRSWDTQLQGIQELLHCCIH